MRQIIGIAVLLTTVFVVTGLFEERFFSHENVEELFKRSALFGIMSVGVAFVIITGGIDLSIGSVICLVGCLFPWLIIEQEWSVTASLVTVLTMSMGIGLLHGLLITRLNLQPFIVTLCGLLIYRGVARGITNDKSQGFGTGYLDLRELSTGKIPLIGDFHLPVPWLVLAAVSIAAALLLSRTVWGRHLFALGRNEEAARYSGVATNRVTIGAYVICSGLAGLSGVLFVLESNSAGAASFGNFYELYAIAGAVLGGCALRGGEGRILGVVIGASIMQVLRSSIRFLDFIPNQLEFAVIGGVILAGVIADEVIRRYLAKH